MIQAMYHINKEINENQAKERKIQLAPHMMWVRRNTSKRLTRLLTVECEGKHAEEVKKRLQILSTEIQTWYMEANVKTMQLIPLRPDTTTDEATLEKLVRLQQNFLEDIIPIHIFNIRQVDWILKGYDISFKSHLLRAKHSKDGSQLIHSLEKVDEMYHIILLVSKNKKECVVKWLKMIIVFLQETSPNTNWSYLTRCDGPFSLEAGGLQSKEQQVYQEVLKMEILCRSRQEEVDSLSKNSKRQRDHSSGKSDSRTVRTVQITNDGSTYQNNRRQVSDKWGKL